MVNLATGKHPEPDELSFAEFMYGYVVISMKAEPAIRPHRDAVLLEMLQDAQEYTWEAIRRAHFAFLEKIEHETSTWDNVVDRQELRRMLVWRHRLAPARAVSAAAPTASKPGPTKSKSHCSYCFTNSNRKFYHALADCRTKKAATLSGN